MIALLVIHVADGTTHGDKIFNLFSESFNLLNGVIFAVLDNNLSITLFPHELFVDGLDLLSLHEYALAAVLDLINHDPSRHICLDKTLHDLHFGHT